MAGEDTYGYTPPHMGPMAQYDTYIPQGALNEQNDEFGRSQDPVVDKDGKSHDNEADVDHAPLEKLVTMVQAESDEVTANFGRLWGDISTLLDVTRRNMKSHADALAEKWNSPAAKSFLMHIGAALYSLDEWKKAADENSSGLYALSRQMETSSTEVARLWEEYKDKYGPMKADQEHRSVGDFFLGDDADLEKLKKDYADRVRPEVQTIASTYLDVYFTKLGGGTKYKGPLDATVTFPGQAPGRPGAPARPGTPPARPGGTRPTAPNRPDMLNQPERPDRPEQPDVTDRPDAPNRPDGLELAGTATAPPPPAPPQVTMPGGGPGGGPAPAPPPTSPLLPSTGGPGSRPGNPGLRSGNAPSRPPAAPQLPGTGGGRGGGSRPGMPQLPGRGGQNARSNAPARPGMPTTPHLPGRGQTARPGAPKTAGQGGAPTTPQLPGRGGQGASKPGAPKGTQPPVTPPNLAGRGGGTGGRPAPAKPTPAIGDQPRTPGVGGPGIADQHGAPQARGTAGLGGRRQPNAQGVGGTEPDPRPALGGRAGTSPTGTDPLASAAGAPRRRPQIEKDEDLWAVGEAAPSVIEKPADTKDERRNPGPTLGTSR